MRCASVAPGPRGQPVLVWREPPRPAAQAGYNAAEGGGAGDPQRRTFLSPTTEGDQRDLWGQGRPMAKDSSGSGQNWDVGTISQPQNGSMVNVESRLDFTGTVTATDMDRATDAREKERIGIFGTGLSYAGSYGRVTSETIGRDLNPLGRGDGGAYVAGSLELGRIYSILPYSVGVLETGNSINNLSKNISSGVHILNAPCIVNWMSSSLRCGPRIPRCPPCPCIWCNENQWREMPYTCAEMVCNCREAFKETPGCGSCQGDDTHWGHVCYPYHCVTCQGTRRHCGSIASHTPSQTSQCSAQLYYAGKKLTRSQCESADCGYKCSFPHQSWRDAITLSVSAFMPSGGFLGVGKSCYNLLFRCLMWGESKFKYTHGESGGTYKGLFQTNHNTWCKNGHKDRCDVARQELLRKLSKSQLAAMQTRFPSCFNDSLSCSEKLHKCPYYNIACGIRIFSIHTSSWKSLHNQFDALDSDGYNCCIQHYNAARANPDRCAELFD